MPANESTPESVSTDFEDTVQLLRGVDAETHALILGEMGDDAYLVRYPTEVLDLVQRLHLLEKQLSLVVMKPAEDGVPEMALAFKGSIRSVSPDTASMGFVLPMGTPDMPAGLLLRGTVKLQGVIVNFECLTQRCTPSKDGRETELLTALPHRLHRIQRRDAFRVPVPPGMHITTALKPGTRHLENLRSLDLSCGGVSVLVKASADEVRVGKRFAKGTISLPTPEGTTLHTVDMLVKHVRLAPASMAPVVKEPVIAVQKSSAPATTFRDYAKQMVGALNPPEVMELGIEFIHMPMSLDRSLSKLVNELAIQLVGKVRD